MAFEQGNKIWLKRATHGRALIFSTPEILWDSACEYFEWNNENPLIETKATHFQGAPINLTEPKMRAMTVEGLCLFLGVSHQTLQDYESRDDFIEVVKMIKSVIRTQKFEGATAGFLNPNIIARDLGLKDKTETEHSGTVESVTMTADEYKKARSEALAADDC